MRACRQGVALVYNRLRDRLICWQVARARQLLQEEHTDIALREGTIVHDRLYNTSVTSVLAGKLTE